MKAFKKSYLFLLLIAFLIIQSGCEKGWLTENPLAALSEESFYSNQNDAYMALIGIYKAGNVGYNGYNNEFTSINSLSGYSSSKFGEVGHGANGYFTQSDTRFCLPTWTRAYKAIARANSFLENIDRVEMDADLKSEYIAETKFLRAYEYYYLSVFFGGVPLITKTLTVEEANNQSRNSYQEIVDFCVEELTESAKNLPPTRPDNERGRILKGAALTVKGRLLMINKRWTEAAVAFKEVIDSDAHQIAPYYKALFEESGEAHSENMLVTNCIPVIYGNAQNQRNYHAAFYGGYNEMSAFQHYVDAFLMNDGLTIEESPLYDSDNPFANRDPRLYAILFLPDYTVFRGVKYQAHPDSTEHGIRTLTGATGYCLKKFVTEDYTGVPNNSGDDDILMRYAEVLLSYLECMIESGDNINQELLNLTINKVRSREEINMPPVTETDPDKLREIVRRERLVELSYEKSYISYIDIRRWGLFSETLNQKFYGMKLTDDPDNYTGGYKIETTGKYRGHKIIIDKTGTFPAYMELLPIPLTEININPNIEQNPGWVN